MISKITILGTGHYGTALANYLRQSTSYNITTASRSTATPPAHAVEGAQIVILAVPAAAYSALIPDVSPHLADGAVVIDAANRPLTIFPQRHPPASTVHALQKMLPPGVFVAKALNTLSAIGLTELTDSEAYTKSVAVPFAAGEPAVKTVETLIDEMGFTPHYKGDLSAADHIEAIPHVFFPAYKWTIVVSVVIWAWWILYSTLSTYVIHGGRGTPSRPWDKYPLSMFMASTGETSMTLFAITFLAGPVAILFKAFGRKMTKWLVSWLDARKQLGLSAFVFASAHGIAGAISASHLDDGWMGQLYFVLGILSYVLFALLAVCSSASVASTLSWAEFRAVFSWLGTAAFVLGIAHQGLWGGILVQHIPNPSFWVGDGRIMPIYWVGILLPMFVVLLRAITWTPCVLSASERRAVSLSTDGKDIDSDP